MNNLDKPFPEFAASYIDDGTRRLQAEQERLLHEAWQVWGEVNITSSPYIADETVDRLRIVQGCADFAFNDLDDVVNWLIRQAKRADARIRIAFYATE